MASKTNKTQQKKDKFLELYAETGNVSLAAKAAGTSRATVYRWKGEDPDFATAWDSAAEEAADRLEQEAWRRAVQGTDEPVHYQGQRVDIVKRYSDTLLIFLLKGFRPKKYQDRQQIQHLGEVKFEIQKPDGM